MGGGPFKPGLANDVLYLIGWPPVIAVHVMLALAAIGVWRYVEISPTDESQPEPMGAPADAHDFVGSRRRSCARALASSKRVPHAEIGYGVTGVAATDTLAMRAAPDANAAIVGTIPHNGEGIVAAGGTTPGGWSDIAYQGKRGWVNARFLGIGNEPRQSASGVARVHGNRALLAHYAFARCRACRPLVRRARLRLSPDASRICDWAAPTSGPSRAATDEPKCR